MSIGAWLVAELDVEARDFSLWIDEFELPLRYPVAFLRDGDLLEAKPPKIGNVSRLCALNGHVVEEETGHGQKGLAFSGKTGASSLAHNCDTSAFINSVDTAAFPSLPRKVLRSRARKLKQKQRKQLASCKRTMSRPTEPENVTAAEPIAPTPTAPIFAPQSAAQLCPGMRLCFQRLVLSLQDCTPSLQEHWIVVRSVDCERNMVWGQRVLKAGSLDGDTEKPRIMNPSLRYRQLLMLNEEAEAELETEEECFNESGGSGEDSSLMSPIPFDDMIGPRVYGWDKLT
jgi:hypothetical protein